MHVIRLGDFHLAELGKCSPRNSTERMNGNRGRNSRESPTLLSLGNVTLHYATCAVVVSWGISKIRIVVNIALLIPRRPRVATIIEGRAVPTQIHPLKTPQVASFFSLCSFLSFYKPTKTLRDTGNTMAQSERDCLSCLPSALSRLVIRSLFLTFQFSPSLNQLFVSLFYLQLDLCIRNAIMPRTTPFEKKPSFGEKIC